ncbi:hypothetical protein FTUN_5430 [Frigoriglobus tundricola]|uniref:Uncharacterized protein n=1 Tax=Frigoriglobus tundricola TaxID=2774151 RepID=A0A6M5YWH4_9BACT|nr:hypothetical protein FTUN_5430 [Frigoriglobus tundricola]
MELRRQAKTGLGSALTGRKSGIMSAADTGTSDHRPNSAPGEELRSLT